MKEGSAISAPEGEDPSREFIAYLHTAATQVTASAMRTRADRERRDRDRRQIARNRVFDQSRARRDARFEADAARRATEHEARMKLHRARLQETLERVRSVQQARTFATSAGDAQKFQHTFDELVGDFAAAVATRDLSPEHAERARLLGEQIREKTGLDPDQVIADAQQRAAQHPDWIDSGHEVTAELADRLVEMHLDDAAAGAATPSDTAAGADTTDRIDQARVGQPPLEPEPAPASAPSQRAEEPSLTEQAEATSASQTRPRDAGTGTTGTGQPRDFADLLIDTDLWRRLLRTPTEPTPPGTPRSAPSERVQEQSNPKFVPSERVHDQSKPIFVPSERVYELPSAEQGEARPAPEMRAGDAEVGPMPTVTGEGADIAEHIDQARVGQAPIGPEDGPVFVPSERVEEPFLEAQIVAVSDINTGRGSEL